MTLAGIEPATFRFGAQHLNHCATAIPLLHGTGEYFRSSKGTTHLHLVPRLRMRGGILLLSLYAFIVWTGTIIYIYIYIYLLLLILYE